MTPERQLPAGLATNNNANMGSVGIQGITDGTSNTAAISEKLIGSNDYTNWGLITASNKQWALRGCSLRACSSTWTRGHHGPPAGPESLPGLQRHPGDPDPKRHERL